MRKSVGVRLPQVIARDLLRAARELDMSQSDLIAVALSEYLARRRAEGHDVHPATGRKDEPSEDRSL